MGKHYLKNTGISLVRKAREIDFGNFGFFDGQEARERWWGCEIRFEPELDELFGITNTKNMVQIHDRVWIELEKEIYEKLPGEFINIMKTHGWFN